MTAPNGRQTDATRSDAGPAAVGRAGAVGAGRGNAATGGPGSAETRRAGGAEGTPDLAVGRHKDAAQGAADSTPAGREGAPGSGGVGRGGPAEGAPGSAVARHAHAPQGDMASAEARQDTVSAVVRQWQAVHPELNTGPMEIIGRINRSAALLQQAEDAPLRRAGLSRPEFDLLGALRRTGHELTPGELARETFSSGAAVTKRLKHLTERGLVERRGDARDRRVAHVRLTDAGRDLVDGILPEQLTYETAVLSVLDPARQGELAALLGELLGQLEGRPGGLRV